MSKNSDNYNIHSIRAFRSVVSTLMADNPETLHEQIKREENIIVLKELIEGMAPDFFEREHQLFSVNAELDREEYDNPNFQIPCFLSI